jgi:hypothetical protein
MLGGEIEVVIRRRLFERVFGKGQLEPQVQLREALA